MGAPHDLSERLAFLNLDAQDVEQLEALRPVLEKQAGTVVAAFYRRLLSFAPTRRLLRDPKVKERLLEKQREYLLSLGAPRFDEDFLEARRRIGRAHEQIGLEPRWYLGAYSLYFSLLTPLVHEAYVSDPTRAARALVALHKLLMLDAGLAMETYIVRHERQLTYLTQELEKEGRRLGRDYERQRDELQRVAERAKAAEELASLATLVAGLAHEIGTPMGVIQGHAKLLESAVSGEDARWRLSTIQEQIGRISRIIQTLLNMARPGRSRRQPVALAPLLETTLSFLREKLSRRGIRLDTSFGPAPSLDGDPERLQQLFLNLFLNAADAMPDGGVLRVALEESDEGEIEVRVADTGAGIPARDIPRIFDPFFTTKPAGEGNGLGLMVAKGIVTDHGGSLDVTSEVGRGTEFRLLFPVASAPPG